MRFLRTLRVLGMTTTVVSTSSTTGETRLKVTELVEVTVRHFEAALAAEEIP